MAVPINVFVRNTNSKRICRPWNWQVFHEDPQVPHYGQRGKGPRMKPGMVFTIEPMINVGAAEAQINESDGWTATTIDGKLSAQFEHTLVVTEDGSRILT